MHKFMLRRSGVSNESGYHQPHLQDCLETVLEQSDALVNAVLAGLQAAMLPVMGKSAALSEPAACRMVASMQAQAPALRLAFAAALRKNVFGGTDATATAIPAMHFDDFQFLDASQLDANIEAAHNRQLVMRSVEDVLPKFNAVVSNLMGWSSVQAQLNPLRPEHFVQALRLAVDALGGKERQARTQVLGVASGLLGVELAQLYREVTDWLRTQGVEAVHMSASKTTGMWNPTKAPDSTVARTILTLDKLRKLLSGELDPQPLPSDRLDFSATIPASLEALQDLKLVEPLMKRLSERAARSADGAQAPRAGASPSPPDRATPEQRKKLGEQLGQEVVQLMLDNLMKDRRLLSPVRISLKALEPVLVALARHDGRFFSERHHPARVFLDRITHRSLAFASEAAPGYAAFQSALDNAVQVLLGGASEASAFARILLQLDALWALEEAGQQQRAAEAARGLLRAEQRNMLARLHSKMLSERLVGIQVPHAVSSFLRGPWAQVVAEAQLHCADGSEDPGGYIGLVDDLLWSVQKHLICNNQARLLELMPTLLLGLRKGLALIAYPQPRMVAFFDALMTQQEKMLDEPEPGASLQSLASLQSEQDSFWVGEREAAEAGYIDAKNMAALAASQGADRRFWQVERLTTGAWVDVMLGDAWERAQLSWASPQRSLYLFLSGQGEAHSMTRHTLEKMKEAGRIRLVADSRVMDKALDAVAQIALDNDLRNRAQHPG